MARWKARGRLYIRRNWTFFAISYGWDVMSGYRSKSALFEGGWVTLSADFRGKGASPTNHCWCQKTRVIAVSCGIKIFAVRCLVFSQYTHLTDRRTDRQTELRQQYRALHYMQSHGKNLSKSALFEGGGSLWTLIADRSGHGPPTTVAARKPEWLPFDAASKYLQCIVWFCQKARAWQVDGRTELRLPRQRYASRGKIRDIAVACV